MSSQQHLRVMIVEDEALIAEGLTYCLRQMGHTVTVCLDNGQEAVDSIEKAPIDCIFMDINMPGMDGLTALELIKQKADIPCIFITGYSDEKTISAASKAGAYGYLTKPVDEADLRAVLAIAIQKHQEHKRLNTEIAQAQEEASIARKMLEERKIVEQARTVLMKKFEFDEKSAMNFMRKKSRDNNRKLVDIAREILKIDSIVTF